MQQALQYGGDGKVGLISLQKFWAFNLALVNSPLKIQCDLTKAKVISRNSAKVEEPQNDLTIQAAAKHYGVNTADPSIDSPPIEIRANYITNAPANYPAIQVNAGELQVAHDAAFGPDGDTDLQVAWLVQYFPTITAAQAAAYLQK